MKSARVKAFPEGGALADILKARPPDLWSETASELWNNTLSRVPSVFERLLYLSMLRNPKSGRYDHPTLSLVFGRNEADRALRASHLQEFSEWLSFTLEEQKADLDLYLSSVTEDKKAIVETWSKLHPYGNLLPATVRRAEKRLYLSDFSALLELLKNEYGAGDRRPDA